MTTQQMPWSLSTSLKVEKLKNTDEIKPQPIGHKKIVQLLERLPPKLKLTTLNYMSASELFTSLLVDNPKVNFSRSFLEYAKYLRSIIGDLSSNPNSEDIIRIFGLDVMKNWNSIDSREHLLEIATDDGIFWEYITWDCPFVVGMLASIQNNDIDTLLGYIDFYKCTDAGCATYIYEYLIRYAFDYRRLSMIQSIMQAFLPYLFKPDVVHTLGDNIASLMKYFSENYKNYSFRNIINDDAEFTKIVEILETCFPDVHKYFQIDWTSYAYHLVKTDDMDKLVELASKLEPPYQALDYEIVIYSIAKKKDAITTVLLSGFEWNDRRDDMDKSRFTDYSKPELEKIISYLMQNMDNSRTRIEAGFDPSFAGFKGKLFKESDTGVNQIYDMHEKRFHMNIYFKSLMARQTVMGKWCNKTGSEPQELFQCMFNDVNERMEFNNGLEKQMVHKLNRSLASINKYHQPHSNVPILIEEFISMCQVMYQFQQYNSDKIDVI
jgi:hypothetical protein